MGFDPATGPALKTALCHIRALVGRMINNRLFAGDLGSIPGRFITKTLKMVLDIALLNTQQYKVRIKGKVEQSKERSSTVPYTTRYYLPTPPLGQDMTQGQFLSGV